MAQYRQIILNESPAPQAYYRLGELFTTSVRDDGPLGYAYDGTMHGSVTPASGGLVGDVNGSLKFGGTADGTSGGYVSLPTTFKTDAWRGFSIECWIEVIPGNTDYARIASNDFTQNDNGGFELILQPSAAGITCNIGNGAAYTSAVNNTALSGATWYHIVATWDGGQVKVYINGTPGTGVSLLAQNGLGTASSAIVIGNGAATTNYFPGWIDELAIYNYALSQAQINRHRAVGIAGTIGPWTATIGRKPVFVDAGSLYVNSAIGRRSTASFYVKVPNQVSHYQQYQQVAIYDQQSVLQFSGYVDKPKESVPGFQPSLYTYITCMDQHYLADKRLVAASYTNRSVGFMVQDMLTNILSAEGVTVGQIYDGLNPSLTLYPNTNLYPGGNVGLVPSAIFSYATVAQALDELAKEASAAGIPYYWQIDQYKRLYFVPYTAIVNSTVVDGTNIEMVRVPPYVSRANPLYRNTQYIVGGYATTVQQDETHAGDGFTRTFTMAFDLNAAPSTLTLNGTSKTVGIRGVDSGKNFYWQQGSPQITQDSGGTLLTSSDRLRVVYIGQYPAAAIDANAAQITYQASLDGTSGIVEAAQPDQTITSTANGLAEASQLLTRYAAQGTLCVFTTLTSGYAQGQLITVNLPMFGLSNAQMLIEEVRASDHVDQYNYWYTIKAVSGPYDTSWVAFFSALLLQIAPANSINIGVSRSLSVLVSFSASLTLTSSLNTTVYACPIPNTTLQPSTTLYPC